MTKEQQNVKAFMEKAGQATPYKPIIPDAVTRILRVKLLLEEVLELAEASGIMVTIKLSEEQKKFLKEHEDGYPAVYNENLHITEHSNKVDLVEVTDALTDIDYVNLGAAVAYGLDLEPFQKEVQRSNMSKFIDGHRREDGKWLKGPSYSETNLAPILEKQQK